MHHGVGVVQRPPVLLNRSATIDLAVALIAEAAAEGASLISFPEAYVPGYPEWIWRLRPGADYELTSELHATLLANAVDLGSDDLAPILAAARREHVTVVLGVTVSAGWVEVPAFNDEPFADHWLEKTLDRPART